MAATLVFPAHRPTTESTLAKLVIIGLVLLFLLLFLLLPLLAVFAEALRQVSSISFTCPGIERRPPGAEGLRRVFDSRAKSGDCIERTDPPAFL